jgi:hypothetical protein
LRRLEPVTEPDRHPPGSDLKRIELVQAIVAECRHRAIEQKAQLLHSDWRGLVLCEVLVDELGEGRHSTDLASAPQLLERLVERPVRILGTREPTSLHALPVSSTDPVAVGP